MDRNTELESSLRATEHRPVTRTLLLIVFMKIYDEVFLDQIGIESHAPEIGEPRYDLIVLGHLVYTLEHTAESDLPVKEAEFLIQ